MATLVPRASGAEARRAGEFLVRLFPEREFGIRLWDGTEISGTGDHRLTLVINSPTSLRRMLRLPVELSLGEAYLAGDFELEGNVWEAGPALEASRSVARSAGEVLGLARLWWNLPRGGRRKRGAGYGEGPARIAAAERSREWDREGIHYHYDAGNDFFSLFLDRRMVYSCAYFESGAEDLDIAQERKLEHVCRKLRLRSGERLLDIGCGWGALVIRAAERYGVHALGVTLSAQQFELGSRRIKDAGLEGRAEIRLLDYRDIRERPFDKVASIGMFEHVGRERLQEYFSHVYRHLAPGGLFLNHGIAGRPESAVGLGTALLRRIEPLVVGGATFRKRYVFPSGGVVPVSEANLVAESIGFEVRDVENLREHYMYTLRSWASRLEARREEAIGADGEGMYRLWRIYMGIAAWQFERGEFGVFQSLLHRPAGGPSTLPLTRADLYD
jgi:cyclopropane-fatty-acyl-phospholipid synthase